VTAAHIGANEEYATRSGAGECGESTPTGNDRERHACRQVGIPAFFTPNRGGDVVSEGKEVREIDGRRSILERAAPGMSRS